MRLSLYRILVCVTALFLQAFTVAPVWGQAESVCTPITDGQNTSAGPVSPAPVSHTRVASTVQPYSLRRILMMRPWQWPEASSRPCLRDAR